MQLLNIGFGNHVVPERIVAITAPDSAPIKRMIGDAREAARLVDATFGRKTKAVIVTDSGHVILCGLTLEAITGRLQALGQADIAKPLQNSHKDGVGKIPHNKAED